MVYVQRRRGWAFWFRTVRDTAPLLYRSCRSDGATRYQAARDTAWNMLGLPPWPGWLQRALAPRWARDRRGWR